MAKILTEMQCQRIKELNRQFRVYAERGWMCEGSDAFGLCNMIFNNETNEAFWADYNGNILDSDCMYDTPIEDPKRMAKIQGDISKVCN